MRLEYPPIQKPYSRNCEILQPGIFPQDMQRVALGVEYNGAGFHGFQRQPSGVRTVQQCLESALTEVANESLSLVCAGRTDAGVHATSQVIHFDTLARRPVRAWTMGVNALLPDSVSVRWALPVTEYFHARFSALDRTYRYLICNTVSRPALACEQLTWVRETLDIVAMREAAWVFVGEHDFTSLRASQCQARSPIRRVKHLGIETRADLVMVEVRANAFLHHMVRNLVGVLLAIGRGEKPVVWAQEVLQARDRKAAGVTAKPNGLHLVNIRYDAKFDLPQMEPGPLLFPQPLAGQI